LPGIGIGNLLRDIIKPKAPDHQSYKTELNGVSINTSTMTTTDGRNTGKPSDISSRKSDVNDGASPRHEKEPTANTKLHADLDKWCEYGERLRRALLLANPKKRKEICAELNRLQYTVENELNNNLDMTEGDEIHKAIRLLLIIRVPYLAAAVGNEKLDDLTAKACLLRTCLIDINKGKEFIKYISKIALRGNSSNYNDINSFDFILSSIYYGSDRFLALVHIQRESPEILFKLRSKSYCEHGISSGYGKEIIDDYPLLKSEWKFEKNNEVNQLVAEAIIIDEECIKYETDLLRDAKYKTENKNKYTNKFIKYKTKDVFGLGSQSASVILNPSELKCIGEPLKNYNVSLYLAYTARHDRTKIRLKMAEIQLEKAIKESKATGGVTPSKAEIASMTNARDGLKKTCTKYQESINSIFDENEEKLITQWMKVYKLNKIQVLNRIHNKDAHSIKKFIKIVRNLEIFGSDILDPSKSNIQDGLVQPKDVPKWKRQLFHFPRTTPQCNFVETAMPPDDLTYLSGIESIILNSVAPDMADRKMVEEKDDGLGRVRKIIELLGEDPARFDQPGCGVASKEHGLSSQMRTACAWQAVILRVALTMPTDNSELKINRNFKRALHHRLLQLGCTKRQLRKIGFDEYFKWVTDQVPDKQKLKNFYEVLTNCFQVEPENEAVKQFKVLLLGAKEAGSFMYLNRSRLIQMGFGASFAGGKVDVSGGIYRDIQEVKISRTADGFKVILYSGKGGRGSVSGGVPLKGDLSGEAGISAGYRKFEGMEITLNEKDFGNNYHDLCQGVVSLVQGKEPNGDVLNLNDFLFKKGGPIRYFTQRQIDISGNKKIVYGDDLISLESGFFSANAMAKGYLGGKISGWIKSKILKDHNSFTLDCLFQVKRSGMAGAEGRAGTGLALDWLRIPCTNLHLPMPIYQKRIENEVVYMMYRWLDRTGDSHIAQHQGANQGVATFLGPKGAMSEEEYIKHIKLKAYDMLSVSNKNTDLLKKGTFDEQIKEFCETVSLKDLDNNTFIKMDLKLTFESEREIEILCDKVNDMVERRGSEKEIKKLNKEIKKIYQNMDNYYPVCLRTTVMHEGSGSCDKNYKLEGMFAGTGVRFKVVDSQKQWFEAQTASKVKVSIPPPVITPNLQFKIFDTETKPQMEAKPQQIAVPVRDKTQVSADNKLISADYMRLESDSEMNSRSMSSHDQHVPAGKFSRSHYDKLNAMASESENIGYELIYNE
jgi:hypothetical protein